MQKKYNRFKKNKIIKKRKEKKKKKKEKNEKENVSELQKPNGEEEVYNNN